ncbi:MAG: hypothetical protein J6D11_02695 [Clostridia bacterium]|nr:hypothetical protein [Clostridia bacterium]
MTKKITRVIALALVMAMACLALASCAKTLSGTYSAEGNFLGMAGAKTSYTFSGSKVTITVTTSNIITGSDTDEYKGTYEITEATDGTLSIVIDVENSDLYSGTFSFSEDKDAGTIKINGQTFTKAD